MATDDDKATRFHPDQLAKRIFRARWLLALPAELTESDGAIWETLGPEGQEHYRKIAVAIWSADVADRFPPSLKDAEAVDPMSVDLMAARRAIQVVTDGYTNKLHEALALLKQATRKLPDVPGQDFYTADIYYSPEGLACMITEFIVKTEAELRAAKMSGTANLYVDRRTGEVTEKAKG